MIVEKIEATMELCLSSIANALDTCLCVDLFGSKREFERREKFVRILVEKILYDTRLRKFSIFGTIWFPFRIVSKHSLYYQLGKRNVIKYSTPVLIVNITKKPPSVCTYPRQKLICIFLHPPQYIKPFNIYISRITRLPLLGCP